MINKQEFTYIGKSTTLSGDFEFNGPTFLQGQLKGEITIKNNSKIVLEIGSYTDGKISCYDLDLYGDFAGEIHSKGKVTIYPTGNFEGKLISKSIEILPGATVNMSGFTEEIQE